MAKLSATDAIRRYISDEKLSADFSSPDEYFKQLSLEEANELQKKAAERYRTGSPSLWSKFLDSLTNEREKELGRAIGPGLLDSGGNYIEGVEILADDFASLFRADAPQTIPQLPVKRQSQAPTPTTAVAPSPNINRGLSRSPEDIEAAEQLDADLQSRDQTQFQADFQKNFGAEQDAAEIFKQGDRSSFQGVAGPPAVQPIGTTSDPDFGAPIVVPPDKPSDKFLASRRLAANQMKKDVDEKTKGETFADLTDDEKKFVVRRGTWMMGNGLQQMAEGAKSSSSKEMAGGYITALGGIFDMMSVNNKDMSTSWKAFGPALAMVGAMYNLQGQREDARNQNNRLKQIGGRLSRAIAGLGALS